MHKQVTDTPMEDQPTHEVCPEDPVNRIGTTEGQTEQWEEHKFLQKTDHHIQ